MERLRHIKSSTSQRMEAAWSACTTLMNPSETSPTNPLTMLWTETIHYTYQQRTQSLRNMMVNLRTYSRRFMKSNTKQSLRRKRFGMNTDWLMTWSPTWLSLMVVSFGLARTTMVMSNLTALLKVTAPLDWWLQSLLILMAVLRLKLLTVLSLDIIDNTRRDKRLQLTLLLLSTHGLEDFFTELNLTTTNNWLNSAEVLNRQLLKPLNTDSIQRICLSAYMELTMLQEIHTLIQKNLSERFRKCLNFCCKRSKLNYEYIYILFKERPKT